jgi:asparagine synthetase B (glutamine-hydrolysing)
MTKQEKAEKLQKLGYSISTPANANYININGMQNGNKTNYFKAKKAKAESIVSNLIYQGFDVKAIKHIDGYFDFYVYCSSDI